MAIGEFYGNAQKGCSKVIFSISQKTSERKPSDRKISVMPKNLDLAIQLFRKGSIILIPDVHFPGGVVKAKFGVLLDDASLLYESGAIKVCLTTSRRFKKLMSWMVETSAECFGKESHEKTTIDCLNRLELTEKQLRRSKFIGYLDPKIWEEVEEANIFHAF